MSLAESHARLRLPAELEQRLRRFRLRVWTIKIAEAVGIAIFAVLLAFLAVFLLDRIWDTPTWVRFAAFVAALTGCAIVPHYLHRWVWRQRRLEQLARLLSRRLPQVGDQLLGIIELVESDTEQARSPALCEAAIRQVSDDARVRDLGAATPSNRYRLWTGLALAAVSVTVALALLFPAASQNAWSRFAAPWLHTPRYTFAAVQRLPDRIIVAHGEPFRVDVGLDPNSLWRPSLGTVYLAGQQPVQARLRDGRYRFQLPPQIDPATLQLHIGDARQRVQVEPTLRPELTSVAARVKLPAYLQRTEPLDKDLRGGAITLVRGSRASFTATATRELSEGIIDGQPRAATGVRLVSPEVDVIESREIQMQWRDQFGLEGKEPLIISVTGHEDEPPTLVCENLPRRKVLLDSDQLAFQVRTHDDFGIKHVGMQWRAIPSEKNPDPEWGERSLAAGDSESESLAVSGTFSPKLLGIRPQPIELRVFAEDYFPQRERVYSHSCVLFVLDPQQHMIWMTEQLSKWHRQSLEVRDRELQLYETNKELRDLSPAELDSQETRRRIEKQAAAERANGRRLQGLTSVGEHLVQEASRNPEFGVGHLEKWAEMLQVLKDISDHRMPSIADLLDEAAEARAAEAPSEASQPPAGPTAGQIRASGTAASGEEPQDDPQQPEDAAEIPAIVDVESSQQPPDDSSPPSPPADSGGKPSLGLPTTTLLGGAKSDPSCPAAQKIEEAVREQEDLLAEFEKVANELNKILGNLEGSTLVKRLKAAARKQYQIGGEISEQVDETFGLAAFQIQDSKKRLLEALATSEVDSSRMVSQIMDDMSAYFQRRRFVRFKTVLDEMKDQDVVGNLRDLGETLPNEQGLSIAQCEYWSDTLDRWAEDLVDPASGGS